jgi:hypothetical protein
MEFLLDKGLDKGQTFPKTKISHSAKEKEKEIKQETLFLTI